MVYANYVDNAIDFNAKDFEGDQVILHRLSNQVNFSMLSNIQMSIWEFKNSIRIGIKQQIKRNINKIDFALYYLGGK